MASHNPRITQLGLGIDEDDVAAIDAWWNPPPSAPVTCPSSVGMLAVTAATMRPMSQTISLELDE